MSQHDPSAPGPRHAQGWSTGAHPSAGAYPRTAHGEPGGWAAEVPEPASVPTDWSPSGAYAGHHTSGYSGDPGGAPAAWLSTPTEPGGAPVAWDQPVAGPGISAPGWSGRHPQPDPAASWNGNTTMGATYPAGPEPATWDDRRAEVGPNTWNGSMVPDRVPAEWNDSQVPDSVPQTWNAEPPTAAWNSPSTSWNAPAEPPAAAWNSPAGPETGTEPQSRNAAPAPADPGAGSGRTRKRNPKMMLAAALAAAALAGGGVGAGLMATFGGDSATTVPAGPGAGQMPGGQPPNGQAPDGEAPTAQPSAASN